MDPILHQLKRLRGKGDEILRLKLIEKKYTFDGGKSCALSEA